MELKQNIYVGDVGETTWSLQKNSGRISYKLNKCHSNVPELEEEEDISQIQTDGTYAKQQLSKGDTKAKILGISLNKQDDQLEVKFGQSQTETTQRGVLQYLASVYDLLGLIPTTLVCGNMIFRQICNL